MTYAEERAALLSQSDGFGPERRRALTFAADRWLASLLRRATGGDVSDVALAAVGGYGRGELLAGSDLDVVLLHGRRRVVGELADAIWYPIWDSGVKLDHAVRTVDHARRVAAEDLKALLGMLDVRHIAGDPSLAEELRSAVLGDWRSAAPKRLPELAQVCRERAEAHGELAFLLEPDLKEARGGLRDVVAMRAVQASWVADPPHARLDAAHERLLDVRDALHTVTGRATDRLVLQEQDPVARALGLLNATTLLRLLAEAGRTVAYASDVTWRRVQQVLQTRSRRGRALRGGREQAADSSFPGWLRDRPPRQRTAPERRPLAEGVVEQDGEAVLARDADPVRDRILVLRAAAAAAQAGLPLAPGTVERLAATATRLPEPWPEEARTELIRLLGAGPAAVPVWEALDLAGVIARLIPDWERVRCRPQRNAVHRFTVDRHLVETAANAAAFTRRVARPDLLLVGALLHDIGKGWPGDHSQTGMAVVRDLGPRLGFPPEDVDVLVTLVEHHLLLPDTATHRDLDDPASVESVVKAVGSLEVLEMLHALTEADAMATGPAAWTPWRASLIGELVRRAAAMLQGEPVPSMPALSESQRALAQAGGFEVLVEPGEHAATVTVVAPDRTGLLATVAGVFAVHRLAVRSATAETVGPMAVTVWTVMPDFGSLPDAAVLRTDVRRALDGSLNVAERLARREAAYRVRPGIPVPPPRVTIVRGASATATVIEVRAHDRPGLLHRIGRALADNGVDVRTARVSTWGAEAVDVFYVVDPTTGRPLSEAAAALARRSVLNALG
jgi:[protein-PII] uridylyltransferase